jgi:hypothetical protein
MSEEGVEKQEAAPPEGAIGKLEPNLILRTKK